MENMLMNTVVIIPARMASTRLPKKMLAEIAGEPLIVRTYKSAVAANVGDVVVACDGEEIATVIRNAGGTAILTDPALTSGTDRVYAAYNSYDQNHKYECVVNLQGDIPFVSGDFIRTGVEALRKTNYDMYTLATPIDDDTYNMPFVVKCAIAFSSPKKSDGKALYFSRNAIPYRGPYYHHVGIYCFRSETLRKFVSLPQSYLELTEQLEQLRALENNITIGISILEQAPPISVDVQEDLLKARKFFEDHFA
jgi:3-deoxy-manno-octulosonate cytidylyltransferase (CMP-KDO synthetase)